MKSLKERLLNVLHYPDRGCAECCRICNCSTDSVRYPEESAFIQECGGCKILVQYNPEEGAFICEHGHRMDVSAFFEDDSELVDTFETLLKTIGEFHENEIVINQPQKDLPLLVSYLKFKSSKDILERRLKGE